MSQEIHARLQLEEFVDEYETSLRAGESPDIASFVDRAPESLRSALLRELLLAHCDYSGSAEASNARSTYLRQLPDFADTINEVFDSPGPTESSAHITLPCAFGDYELVERIAAGAMGIVYRAEHHKLGRTVAMKVIQPGLLHADRNIKRFFSEARAVADLDHPGITSVYDVGEHEGQVYFTMALIDGGSLADAIRDNPLGSEEAARIMRDVARAVQTAHDAGIVHRDLKPANILLTRSGEPRVSDFGLAKRVSEDSGLTATGMVLGTPAYMPPEQATGDASEVGPAADIYSLGATLYAAITGRPPFQADTIQNTLLQVTRRDPIPPRTLNPDVALDLDTICMKCLSKEPQRRYPSAAALADELDRFLDGRPIEARPIGRLEKVWRWTQRNRAVAALAAAFLLALICGLAGVTRQWLVAREAEQRANQSAELAQQQAEVAMGTLSEVISRIQRRLVLIPEAREIRQEMLELSLTGLQQVAGDLNNRHNRDEYLITAHFELGDLFLRLGGPNGVNATEDAIAQFDKAERIARQLAEKDPDATHAQSDLMYLYERRGNIENSQGNFEECIRYYKQALKIAERLAERDPNSNDRVRSLWFINFIIGTNEQLRFDFHAAARHYAAANAVLQAAREAELAFVDEPDTQVFFDDTQRRMRFCELMPQALADESFALNEEPELAKELTYQRARTLAHRGQVPAAMKSLQLLLDIGDTNAGDQYNLACVYALCMRSIIEEDDQGQASDTWRECHRQALARIQAAWEGGLFDDAELCVILARDPDLEALRGNADFEQLVEDILHDKAR